MGTSGSLRAVLDRGGGAGEGGRGVARISEGDAGSSVRSVEGWRTCSGTVCMAVLTFPVFLTTLSSCDRTM